MATRKHDHVAERQLQEATKAAIAKEQSAPGIIEVIQPTLIAVAGISPDDLAAARRALNVKLSIAIREVGHVGDVGNIARLVEDLQALDLVTATLPARVKVVPPADPPEIAERKAAAADPAKMQVYNRKVAVKERGESAKEEGVA